MNTDYVIFNDWAKGDLLNVKNYSRRTFQFYLSANCKISLF